MLKNDLKLPFPFIKDGQQNDKKNENFLSYVDDVLDIHLYFRCRNWGFAITSVSMWWIFASAKSFLLVLKLISFMSRFSTFARLDWLKYQIKNQFQVLIQL